MSRPSPGWLNSLVSDTESVATRTGRLILALLKVTRPSLVVTAAGSAAHVGEAKPVRRSRNSRKRISLNSILPWSVRHRRGRVLDGDERVGGGMEDQFANRRREHFRA